MEVRFTCCVYCAAMYCLLLDLHTLSIFCRASFPGDEAEALSRAMPMEEEEDDDDDDPENRYDTLRKDLETIITHPRRGRKPAQRRSKQGLKGSAACPVKTRARASRKCERGARKQRPRARNAKQMSKSGS